MRVCSVHTVSTPTQRAEGRGSTMYYAVPLFQPGGEERRPPSSSRSVGLSSGISFPSISHCHHPASVGSRICSTVSIGARPSCRSVRPVRCRSSSEVNVPVHDLQAVAVLRLRDRPGHLHAQHTSTPTPTPSPSRPHRPIGPSAHRAHSETRPNRSATTVANS